MRVRIGVLLVFAAVVALCGQQTASGSVSVTADEWVVMNQSSSAVSYGDGGEFQVDVYSSAAGTPWGAGASGLASASYNATAGKYTSPYANYVGTFYTFCASINEEFGKETPTRSQV